MARVRINTNGKGRGKIFVDDQPIHMVTDMVFQSKASGHVDRLTLDLVMYDGAEIESDDATVSVAPKTAEALMRLGWKPPA
ncbi:MAG TPA: hypothetical protein VJQ80_14260 [Arthrobacter sp.]|nr:hypothetical protein [Arthrobacter sp.]